MFVLTFVYLPFISIYAQFKLTSSGDVGIGTTSPNSKLEIRDYSPAELKLYSTNTNGISRIWHMNYTYSYGFGLGSDSKGHIFKNINNPSPVMTFDGNHVGINNTNPGSWALSVYGSFWVNGTTACSDGYWSFSDERFKENITPINLALEKITRLNGKSYIMNEKFIYDSIHQKKYGLIAQEVRAVIPELVKEIEDSVNYLTINYDGLIPFLIEAIKELEHELSKQESELIDLESRVLMLENVINTSDSLSMKNAVASINGEHIKSDLPKLYQNSPNPFNTSTRIEYFLPEDVSKASIYIYDMHGTQLKGITLENSGYGNITVNGGEFEAGIYLYSLIANGQVVGTKQMVLTD